jgi:hypothetical protein
LPHRGAVHRTKVPVEVATLTAAPLPLALDSDTAVLTPSDGAQVWKSIIARLTVRTVDDMQGADGGLECAVGEHECAADGSGSIPRRFTYPLHQAVCC